MSSIVGSQGAWSIRLTVDEISRNPSTNTSSASWSLVLYRNDGGTYGMWGTPTIYIYISGQLAHYSAEYRAYSAIGPSGVTVVSGTLTGIPHNSDGSIISNAISFSWSGSGFSPSSVSASGTYTTTPVPRMPTLSDISINGVTDATIDASFTVTYAGNEQPSNPYIEAALDEEMTQVAAIISARSGTLTGLDANRTYYIRGQDSNSAGTAYTDIVGINTIFNAPGSPGAPALSYSGTEPIPTSTLSAVWTAASAGSTDVAGYALLLYKNGTLVSEIDTGSTAVSYNFGTFTSLGFVPGDVVTVGIVSYSEDWEGTKHYGLYEITSSNSITVVSDKFIYVSDNGGAFTKHKMYISVNGASFVEVKKSKFNVIQ